MLLDRSIEGAGGFLRDSFESPAGHPQLALATVTRKGEPRVAPVGSLFFRGRFHVPTVRTAARTRHLGERPSVSLTLYEGDDLAIIAHGRAEVLAPDHPDFAALGGIFHDAGGQSVLDWGDGVYPRVEAEKLYTFARYPERFPG